MARTKISEFSSTPGNNTDIDSINIAEGCAPSGINDAIRELMAQLKDFQQGTAGDSFNGPVGTTTAAAGAFTTLAASGAVTLSGGTANGVPYLNGSKVLTTGSALTFDGTNLGVGTASPDIFGRFYTRTVGITSNGSTVIQLNGSSYGGIDIGAAGTRTFGLTASATDANLTTTTNIPILFGVNGSEQMRLTSTGLGIGTSSPQYKLDIGNATANTTQMAGTTGGVYIYGIGRNGTNGAEIDSYDAITFRTGSTSGARTGSEKMRLDQSGNLGLGVTPSTSWFSGSKVFQFGATGALWTNGSNNSAFSHNAVFGDASTTYQTTGAASYYRQFNGGHNWFTAPSGTAGNAISFTQAMTLDASGNLLVGTTSANGRLTVDSGSTGLMGSFNSTNANGGYITGQSSSTAVWDLGTAKQALNVGGSTDFGINVRNGFLSLGTGNTERMRLDSSGNLLVGTTSGAFSGKVVTLQTTSASNVLTAWNSATSGDNSLIGFFTDGGSGRGSITYNRGAGLVAYNTTSDYRAKDIIGPVTDSGALIDSVPVYMGKMKGATQERPMFIAHETPAYAHTGEKDAVDTDGNPVYQQMDASALVPVMWAEIQSLRKRLAAAGI